MLCWDSPLMVVMYMTIRSTLMVGKVVNGLAAQFYRHGTRLPGGLLGMHPNGRGIHIRGLLGLGTLAMWHVMPLSIDSLSVLVYISLLVNSFF